MDSPLRAVPHRLWPGQDGRQDAGQLAYTRMGDKADDILTSFRLSTDDSEKYTSVCEKFDSHFVRCRNTIYERAKFNQRVEQQGESADLFVTDLYALAENFRTEDCTTK